MAEEEEAPQHRNSQLAPLVRESQDYRRELRQVRQLRRGYRQVHRGQHHLQNHRGNRDRPAGRPSASCPEHHQPVRAHENPTCLGPLGRVELAGCRIAQPLFATQSPAPFLISQFWIF